MTVREMLAAGGFNNMSQTVVVSDPDPALVGATLAVLTKRGDPHTYKMWVTNLYKQNEVVLKEEIL